jgi:hypothetical protein
MRHNTRYTNPPIFTRSRSDSNSSNVSDSPTGSLVNHVSPHLSPQPSKNKLPCPDCLQQSDFIVIWTECGHTRKNEMMPTLELK